MERENSLSSSLYIYRDKKDSSKTPYVSYSNESQLGNLTLVISGENLSETDKKSVERIVKNCHTDQETLKDRLRRRFPNSFSSF